MAVYAAQWPHSAPSPPQTLRNRGGASLTTSSKASPPGHPRSHGPPAVHPIQRGQATVVRGAQGPGESGPGRNGQRSQLSAHPPHDPVWAPR